jgi:hypothetical protein
MKQILVTIAMFLACVGLTAQAATTAAYDVLGATPAVVATYQQVITVDGVLQTATPVCGPKGTTDTTCSIVLNTPLGSGTHVISVAETLNNQTAELRITGLNPNNAPKSATNVRIISTTTIVIP